MLEIGQPTHAYDLDKLNNILVVEKGKFFGIKGPAEISISEKTKNILLESANFNPADIRETSKKLGLKTEASTRFERGVDINLCKIALEKGVKRAHVVKASEHGILGEVLTSYGAGTMVTLEKIRE